VLEGRMVEIDDRVILVLSGDLTIQNGETAKELLLGPLGRSSHVTLDLSFVTDFDLAGLQLLCAAHKTALTKGTTLSIEGKDTHLFRKIVLDAGFLRHVGCSLDRGESCFWREG
jgi:anti-anti-sigma regulatory factor